MGYLDESSPSEPIPPLTALHRDFGFVPNLFRAQARLPRIVEAEAEMAAAVVLHESDLSRVQKECILLVVAAAHRNSYCVTAHYRRLQALGVPEERLERLLIDHARAGLRRDDVRLLDFCLKLALHPSTIGPEDLEDLRRRGLVDEEILEAILVTSLTHFLCSLSTGLGVEPDGPLRFRPFPAESFPDTGGTGTPRGRLEAADQPASARPGAEIPRSPYLRTMDLSPDLFPPFAFFMEKFGLIPSLFRAQTLRPDVVAAEAKVVDTVFLRDDILSRRRKEYILLAVSGAHLSTRGIGVPRDMLCGRGMVDEESEAIALDYRQARLSDSDRALLDFAVKLSTRPGEYGPDDLDRLRHHRFTEEQILEAVVMTSLARFLGILQTGLGAVPDSAPRIDHLGRESAGD